MENKKEDTTEKDSFGNKPEKSPWAMFAMLQIPVVIIMVIIVYVMFSSMKN